MHIAQVSAWGESPKYTQVADLPEPKADEVRIKVEAAGAHRVVRARAAGKHYSAKSLPHVPGIDGVGKTTDGQQVYFSLFSTGEIGSLSEYVNVPKSSVHALQGDVNAAQIAGMVNPASSSWLAFKSRVNPLPANFSVLVIGATTASGRLAVSLAKALGAKRIIGAARNQKALDELALDQTILLADGDTDFSKVGDVDVVLDYIYGPVAEKFFASLNSEVPVQYVQIGTLGGLDIKLPGDLLRSKNLTLRGSGPGAWSFKESAESLPELLKVLGNVNTGNIKTVPLKDIESEWEKEGSDRLVFIP